MAYIEKLGNYVKFLRGTPSAWERLGTKNADTLYFISEDGAQKGKLYLGDKLIADGENITKLSQLEDVFDATGLPTNTILAYDAQREGWVPKTLQEIFSIVVGVMTGATEEANGISGLVPKPEAGQNGLYLRGDATWANPTAAVELQIKDLDEKIDEATEKFIADIKNLRGGYSDESTIPQIAKDVVSTELAKIVANAPEQFDTLKEIADWLQAHDNVSTVTDLNDRVEKVELAVFGPDGKTGLVQEMTTVNTTLFGDGGENEGMVSFFESWKSKIPSMEGKIVTLETGFKTVTQDILDIKDLLKWRDLVYEADVL